MRPSDRRTGGADGTAVNLAPGSSLRMCDDLLRDDTDRLLAASQQTLESSGVTGRIHKRAAAGRGPMRANPRQWDKTEWLERLNVSEVNDLIDQRKAEIIEKHIVSGTRANRITAMSQYVEFCEIRGYIPIRDAGLIRELTRTELIENENIAIEFAIYESWRVTPAVVAQYVSHVFMWHLMELGVDMKEGRDFKRLTKVLSGLKKLFPHAKRVRFGIKPKLMLAIIRFFMGQLKKTEHTRHSRQAFRLILLFTWCYQGLYRGGEGARGSDFDPRKHLTCADPQFADGGKLLVVRNPELKVANKHTAVPFPFPVEETDVCSFGAWFALSSMYDPLDPGEDPALVPLFNDPKAGTLGERLHTKCLTYDVALDALRGALTAVSPNGIDTSKYGLHSMRIGAASALFALGCPPMIIQTLGRWASDIYEIYCRAHRHQLVEWTSRLSSADYDTLEEL